MPQAASTFTDLVNSTLPDLDRDIVTDLSSDLRKFTFADQLLDEKKRSYDSGISLRTNVVYRNNGQAANVLPGQLDDVNNVEVSAYGTIDWRMCKTDYCFDQRLAAQNSGAAQIFDMIKAQYHAGIMAQLELWESNAWIGSPVAGDVTTPCSINSFIVYSATDSTEGVPTGGNATGSTAGFILDSTNVSYGAKWKNYCMTYTNPTLPDLVRKIRDCMEFSDYYSPSYAKYTNARPDRGMYTNYGVLSELESLVRAQNENLGTDLAMHDGDVFIRKIPVKSVPKLASRTTSMPVYGIDWKSIYPCYLNGWFMKKSKLKESALDHNLLVQFLDTQYNWRAKNRRSSFLVAKSDPVNG